MECPTPLIRARRRIMCHQAKAFQFMVVLMCILFQHAACELCSIKGIPCPVESDTVEPYINNKNARFQDVYVDGVGSGFVSKSRLGLPSVENICSNSNLFSFPSTLPDFLSEECMPESTIQEASGVQSDATSPLGSAHKRRDLNRSSDYGMFLLFGGCTLSCSLNSQERICDISSIQTSSGNENHVSSCEGPLHIEKIPSSNLNGNCEIIKSGFLDGSLSPCVEIIPPLLDWGQKYLYSPSFAFLTVENTHSDITLNIYEPFCPNTQFYPCNFSDVLLRPGESASICFVFLPTWLGMSSAHLILQTSSGGFLIQAKGYAVESLYLIRPLMGVDISSGGRWRKNLSLFNPFDETLYVEEVIAWISASSGNTSHSTKAICKIENSQSFVDSSVVNIKEWLDVKGGRVGSPLLAMTPHGNWDIGPGSTETILEIDYSYHSAEKFLGAFCLQLLRSSGDKSDMIMVPLEFEVGESSNRPDSVSLSLDTLVPCDAGETAAVALSLRNGAPHLLNVVKISVIGEGTKLFQVKYVEGLILFPGTATQVAVVSYLSWPPSEFPNTELSCGITILINDSSSPEIEVLCKDIVNICWKLDSFSNFEQDGKAEHANARTGSLGSHGLSSFHIKAMGAAEPDELVLGNWKSLGIPSGIYVLHDHEVLFRTVQVGTYQSKWITVKNPSQQPVVMQLILNSGVIVDECRSPDGTLQPSSSSGLFLGEYAAPIRYGFSIGESAQTVAYVHPYETASLGPILFHPSNRCAWRGSALIRNNLSGVEWLPLRGFGGSLSLVLFEGSMPVHSLEFKLNLPSLNISPHDVSYKMEDPSSTCFQPFSKELYAKNMGDFPLELRRIKVSGTECGLDGFLVHTCKGFDLKPGESIKLFISYKTDFSAVNVQRELELALGTGILVIPMKASLPLHLHSFCKKSMFLLRVKKFSFVFLSTFGIFVVLFYILPQLLALGSQDYTLKRGESSIATVRHIGKSSRVHRNQNSGKFFVSSKMNGLFRSIKEKTLLLDSVTSYPDGEGVALEHGHVKTTVGNQRQTNYLLHVQKEMAFESCALPESSTVEHSDVRDASKDGKLTVRVGKEKGGRRRRKRKGSGTGLTGIFEVSSSQSGNSTPSSPLSPVTSFTPKRSWPVTSGLDQTFEARNQFAEADVQTCQKISGTKASTKGIKLEPEVSMKFYHESRFVLIQEKPSAPKNLAGKPILLPSATFPCTNRRGPIFMASTSSIPPHARAPGSKVYNQKAVQTEEKTGHEDQFKYDIWGDHLSGLHLIAKPKEGSSMTSSVSESHSDSFFVSGPQTLSVLQD